MTEIVSQTGLDASPMLPEALLTTKLFVPPVRSNLVHRPRLVHRLNEAAQVPPRVIVLSAPPGFGKTTLLSEWARQYQMAESMEETGSDTPATQTPRNVAWVSLDDGDNDPRRFLMYCIAALQTIQPTTGKSTITELYDQHLQPISSEQLLTPLLNEVAGISKPFLFVLDDYHVIKSSLIHDGLAFLLSNLPAQAVLVIASRTDLSISLGRIRSQGYLTELHGPDLAFTPDETATFLNRVMNLHLSPKEVIALEARTEGWIAGLQMAALSMKGLVDTAGFVKAFTGSHRYVMDYLLEEVLTRQPDHVQRFLLFTSLLNRQTGPLCDSLIRAAGLDSEASIAPTSASAATGQQLLEQLEQANLFIVPLDDQRRWYRYHQLFADLLRHRLRQSVDERTMSMLHRHASDWFEQHGYTTEALQHALQAVDTERAVRLVKQKAAALLSRSELIALISWLDNLPQELIHLQSRLSLLSAWAMLLTGQLAAVETNLQEVEGQFHRNESDLTEDEQANLLGEVATLRAAMAYFQRDMPRAIKFFDQALEHIPVNNLFLRGIILQSLGAAYSWHGDVIEATRAFSEAGRLSRLTGNDEVSVIALWSLAQLWVERGELRQAEAVYRQALELIEAVEPAQTDQFSTAARIYVGLAELMIQWNDQAVAEDYLAKGLKQAKVDQGSGTLAGAYVALARSNLAQGDTDDALEAIQHAGRLARHYSGPFYWASQAAIFQARLWLIRDNVRAAQSWAEERDLWPAARPHSIPYLREGEYLILVRLLLGAANPQNDGMLPMIEPPLDMALEILAVIVEAARDAGRIGRVLEAELLKCLVFYAQGEREHALSTLEEVIILAEPQGYIRLFVDEGPLMADLIGQLSARHNSAHRAYLTKLLIAFKPTPAAAPLLLDPLSARELEIVGLIATGMSNKQLAETLFLTVGTVKWHLNNIYSKLDVRSRTQAVAKARELGLV